MTKIRSKRVLATKPLRLSSGIGIKYSNSVVELLKKMYESTRKVITEQYGASQARIAFIELQNEYITKFNDLAKSSTNRMVSRTLQNSEVTLKLSLKDMSQEVAISAQRKATTQLAKNLSINASSLSPEVLEVTKASATQAASLIKRIPQEFLGDVQEAVMRSIVANGGQAELQKYLTTMYHGKVKWARHVALDQTRKTFEGVNRVRMEKMGIKKFEWQHVGGSMHPRKYHEELDGQVFEFAKPPIIDKKTGERGFPGQLPFCRCQQIPVVELDD